MPGFAQPEDRHPTSHSDGGAAGTSRGYASGASQTNRRLEESELDSALQLLVERAQYITGATGTALALPQGEEMVCRASAGASAPVVGARLQVLSGLTGESIARRQLLRCDNAETDPRVNLEACRALGIASIVVLPLFRQSGEVRGLIELFSDHPYAFEERDLVALERMADLTMTALDLAEQRHDSAPATVSSPPRRDLEKPPQSGMAGGAPQDLAVSPPPATVQTVKPAAPPPVSSPRPAEVPEAMRRIEKCASCGFPVSEGREVCVDCERKKQLELKQSAKQKRDYEASSAPAAPKSEEFVPAFLANAVPVPESWWANHVNILALIVLILGIAVAVVVFR